MNEQGEQLDNEAGRSFDLSSLIQFKNPERAAYDALIRDQESIKRSSKSMDIMRNTRYGDDWGYFDWPEYAPAIPIERDSWQKGVAIFSQKLKNQILVDLGGSNLPSFATHFGVKAYIGVDRYFDLQRSAVGPDQILFTEKRDGTEIIKIQDDMLDFVSRIQSGSVIFVMNGIDFAVIRDERYHQAVAREMIRATKQGDLIFGTSAFPISHFMNSEEAKSIFRDGDMIIKMKQ